MTYEAPEPDPIARKKNGRFALNELPISEQGPAASHIAAVKARAVSQSDAHRFRQRLMREGSDQRIGELVELLWGKALAGDQWAMQEILNRYLGKPRELIEIEGSTGAAIQFNFIRKEQASKLLGAHAPPSIVMDVQGLASDD